MCVGVCLHTFYNHMQLTSCIRTRIHFVSFHLDRKHTPDSNSVLTLMLMYYQKFWTQDY